MKWKKMVVCNRHERKQEGMSREKWEVIAGVFLGQEEKQWACGDDEKAPSLRKEKKNELKEVWLIHGRRRQEDSLQLGEETVYKSTDSCVEEEKANSMEKMMGDKESFYPNPEVAC